MLLGKYLNKYYLKYLWLYLIGVLGLVAVDWFQLLLPEYLGKIVDLFGEGSVDTSALREVVVGVIFVALVLFSGRVMWRLSIFAASQKTEAGLRRQMFVKAEKLPLSYFGKTKVGTVMAWFTTDLETIEDFLGWGTIMLFDASFLTVLVIIKMVRLDWVLSLIVAVPLILIAVWGALVEKFQSAKWTERQTELDNLYDYSRESFTGIRVIKAFLTETRRLHAFAKIVKKNKAANVSYARMTVLFDCLISLIIAAITAIILGVGGYFVYGAVTNNPAHIFGHTVGMTAGGVSDTYGVEVIGGAAVAVTNVTLNKDALELTAGDSATLSATINPDDADDQSVTWSSSNTAAATVKNGVVTAVSAGTATITVTTNDGGHTATCQVTVKALAPGKDPSKPSDPLETPENPVISNPAQGVTITKASAGELEAAYVEWTAANSADWYNVYVSPEGENNWTRLDAPLVRQYQSYYRADAVGLKAGTYDMKVVPVDGNGAEAAQYAATAEKITVYAHERSGYAFVGGTSSGAYNEDGTLKSDAIVLYVTDDNYDKITLETGKGTVTGIDNILGEGYQKKKGDTKPLCVRIIGSIGDGNEVDFKANGDLELKGLDQGVTVEGIGNDATANGWGFHITGCTNVEIRNIGVMNMKGGTKDGIGFEGNCDHVWVHNCDFFYGHNWGGDQAKGDGSLDTKKTTYVTHSYNHFWDSGKCNLQGMKDASEANAYVTYHHNWYDHSDSRHPRIRRATVHIYNNYFDGNAKYGVGVTLGASAFVENNYFRSTAKMKPMLSSMQGTDIAHGKNGQTFSGEDGGIIKAYGNHFEGTYELLTQNDTDADNIDCYLASSRTEKVPATYKTKQGGTTYNNFDTADNMYEYSVDTPEQAKTKVTRYAGRVDGGDLKFVFDNATQDSNYNIIPELANKLEQYANTLTLVKIGKDD